MDRSSWVYPRPPKKWQQPVTIPPCAISKVEWVPLLSFFCRDICGVSVCLWQLVFVVLKDVNEVYNVVPTFPLLGIWTYNHGAWCKEGNVVCSMQFLRLQWSKWWWCRSQAYANRSISKSNMWRDGSNIKAYLKLRSKCSSRATINRFFCMANDVLEMTIASKIVDELIEDFYFHPNNDAVDGDNQPILKANVMRLF